MTANAPALVSRSLQRSLTLRVGAAEQVNQHTIAELARKFEYDRLPLNCSFVVVFVVKLFTIRHDKAMTMFLYYTHRT